MKKHLLVVGGRDASVLKPADLGIDVTLFQLTDMITDHQRQAANRTVQFASANWESGFDIACDIHRTHPFDGVVSFTEWGVEIASEIGEHLGVPCNSLDLVLKSRNKLAMRRLLQSQGFESVMFRECNTLEDLEQFVCELRKPGILKPVAGSGSTGVCSFASLDEARCAWRWTSNSSSPPYIAEEVFDGVEVSVEGLTLSGHHEILAVTMKETTGHPHFIEIGHTLPACIDDTSLAGVESTTLELLDIIGHREGPSHTELRLQAGKPFVVETHTRIGGDQIWEMVELVCGRDQISETCAHLVGLTFQQQQPLSCAAGVRFFLYAPGRITEVRGVEEAANISGVIRVSMHAKPGELLPILASSRQRQGYVLAIGDTASCVRRTLDDAFQIIDTRVEAS